MCLVSRSLLLGLPCRASPIPGVSHALRPTRREAYCRHRSNVRYTYLTLASTAGRYLWLLRAIFSRSSASFACLHVAVVFVAPTRGISQYSISTCCCFLTQAHRQKSQSVVGGHRTGSNNSGSGRILQVASGQDITIPVPYKKVHNIVTETPSM